MESPEDQNAADDDRDALRRELRRTEILRRLRLVDPGSYAFYTDVVKLLEEHDEGSLYSLSHIVAHLLRELESAIRNALGPTSLTAPEWPEDRINTTVSAVQEALVDLGIDNADPLHASIAQTVARRGMATHSWHIHATLRFLGIPDDHPVRKQWIELVSGDGTKLAYLAHRQALEGPRKLGGQLHQLMEAIDSILDVVLERFEERFALYLKRVDELLSIASPAVSDVDIVKNRLPNNPVIRERFFSLLDNPAWLKPLKKRKVFANIPEPEKTGEGLSFPAWLPVLSLQGLAEKDPGNVFAVMESLAPSTNDWVNGRLMDVALKLPVDLAARWARREAARIVEASSLYLWFSMSCRKMIERLAEAGEHSSSFALARALLGLRAEADPRAEIGESLAKARGETFDGERKTTVMKIAQHDYAEITAVVADKLAPHLGVQVLEELAALLEYALENDGYPKEPPDDHSYIWKASISDEQRHYAGDAHEMLVSPVRDAALSIATDPKSTKQVLAFLFERKWRVFWRIGLYVAAKKVDPGTESMLDLALDQRWGHDWAKYPEYFMLLRRAFTGMTDEEKSQCLTWATQYPNLDVWKANFKESRKRDPTDDDVKDYKAYRSVRALWRINDVLPPDWRAKYDEWSSMQGGTEAAEIESMPKGIRTVGGPKRAEELAQMPLSAVLKFLKDWEPDTSFHSTTYWATDLARNVAVDVKRRHHEYIQRFDELLEMGDPTWCAAVMNGLSGVELNNEEWASTLQFCSQLVAWGPNKASPKAEEFSQSSFAENMSWCRMTILEFLKQGLYTSDDQGGRPFVHREPIWDMLSAMAEDLDPRMDDAVRRNDDPDYDMTALNRVRPQVVETAIWFGIWYIHNVTSPNERKERAKASTIEDVPGLGDLLSRHIDTTTEPHPSVWAVYGQHFARLLYLGRDWVEKSMDDLLPSYDQDEFKRTVVWRSFIKHYRGDWTTSDFLSDKFLEEVERLSPAAGEATDDSGRELDNRLALHLMIMFWWRAIGLDGPLLTAFFERAPDSVRAYAIWYLGNQYNDFLRDPDEKNDATDLLKQLWIVRNHAAEASGGKGFEQEMGAFLKFFTAGGPVLTPVVLDHKKDKRPVTFERKRAFNGDDGWALDRLTESLKWARGSRSLYDTELARKFASYAGHELQGKAVRALRLLVESHRADFGLSYWLADADELIKATAESADPETNEECYRLINILGSVGIDTYRGLLPEDRGGPRLAEVLSDAKASQSKPKKRKASARAAKGGSKRSPRRKTQPKAKEKATKRKDAKNTKRNPKAGGR